MSFTGDLDHLPIVDVIQLLHATRKTGTLCLNSPRGECQLTFHDGYIVGANHSNTAVRIGQLLVERQVLSEELLQELLQQQTVAGEQRKPLIAMLLEGGHITREAAFKGLEYLIQLTIVEVLCWERGTFTLDVDRQVLADEYRYFPEQLKQDLSLNTQNLLMDALRIFDERRRDGVAEEESGTDIEFDLIADPPVSPAPAAASPEISEDLLGLADLDSLERKIPGVFSGIKDHDPVAPHRRLIKAELPWLAEAEQERLSAFLATGGDGGDKAAGGTTGQAVIVFSIDPLLRDVITAGCRSEGQFVFATDDPVNLDPIIDQSLGRNLAPVLVLDPQSGEGVFSEERLLALRQEMLERYPALAVVQLVWADDRAFLMQQTFCNEVTAVLPRPNPLQRSPHYADELFGFLAALRDALEKCRKLRPLLAFQPFFAVLGEMQQAKEAPEVAYALLKAVATVLPRALVLVVGKGELVSERGFGLVTPPPKVRIPLAGTGLLGQVIESGESYCAVAADAALKQYLWPAIGAPRQDRVLLLPLHGGGRVLALIYGDFGSVTAGLVPMELLELAARHAGLVLDAAGYRKRFEKPD